MSTPKVTQMQMVNLQSWKDQTFHLSDGLTAIEAPSETGKSVYIKAIRLATERNSYSTEEYKSIIRRGCDYGRILFANEENTVVYFTFYPTRLECGIRYKGESFKRHIGPATDEMLRALGLIKVGNRIINILDNEHPMLFDGTESEYNDSLLKDYIYHQQTEEMIKSCEENLDLFKIKTRLLRNDKSTLESRLVSFQVFGDVYYVKSRVHNAKILANVSDRYEELTENLKHQLHLNHKNEIVNFNKIYSNMQILNTSMGLYDELKERLSLDYNYKPTIQDLNKLELTNNMNNLLLQLQNNLSSLIQSDNRPTTELTDKLSFFNEEQKLVNQVLTKLLRILELKEKPITSLTQNEKLLNILSVYQNLIENLSQLDNQTTLCLTSEEEVQTSKLELNKLKEELKVCPLCGSIMEVDK